MTAAQLEVARKHQNYHANAFGYAHSNVEFIEGELETLSQLGLEQNSFDLVVSNCVINLCTDKRAVLRSVYELLKPGGEMYFSDVYASRRIPDALKNDPVLYGECLSGAYYWNDFLHAAKQVGFKDPRLVNSSPIVIESAEVGEKLSGIDFYSATYRLFKLENLEANCEDYGQAVIYKGGIPYQQQHFVLDEHHIIERGKVFPVCGNTDLMLRASRFAPHFDFIGDQSQHFGIFEGCGTALPFQTKTNDDTPCC